MPRKKKKLNGQDYTAYSWAECIDKWKEIHCKCLDKILRQIKADDWRYIYIPSQLAESTMKQIAAISVLAEGKDMDAKAYSFIFSKIPKAQERVDEALN